MYKVWYSALNYIVVSTYKEALTLRMMVRAASKSNIEPCHIELIVPPDTPAQ